MVLVERCLVGAIFLVAAAGKAWSRRTLDEFAGLIRDIRVIPARWSRRTATAVVVAEAAVPVLLLPAATTVAGFALAAVLLLGLAGVVALVLRRGMDVTCLCFGTAAASLRLRHLVRNLVLAAVAASGALGAAVLPAASDPVGAVVAVGAGIVVAALVVVMDDIVDLFSAIPAR